MLFLTLRYASRFLYDSRQYPSALSAKHHTNTNKDCAKHPLRHGGACTTHHQCCAQIWVDGCGSFAELESFQLLWLLLVQGAGGLGVKGRGFQGLLLSVWMSINEVGEYTVMLWYSEGSLLLSRHPFKIARLIFTKGVLLPSEVPPPLQRLRPNRKQASVKLKGTGHLW